MAKNDSVQLSVDDIEKRKQGFESEALKVFMLRSKK